MKPKTSYIVCAVQRSGSSLLCEALKNTGLAGFPEEYFLDGECWEDGSWARQHGASSRKEYLDLVFEYGTSTNGVFGAKLMWNYFHTMLGGLGALPGCAGLHPPQLMASLFPDLHYIWIVRKDTVRQAVSWARAGQTGVYACHKGESPVPKQEPRFDFAFIDQLYHLILKGEAGWQHFFAECGVQPFRVQYEELVQAYESTALRILAYLGISCREALVFGERQLQRQADELNEAWVEQYLRIKQAAE